MRLLSLAALPLAVALLAHTPPTSTAATQPNHRREAVQKEVRQFMSNWVSHWEHLDLERAMEGESDAPDFLYADVDGRQYDKAGLRKLCLDMLAGMASEKVFTHKDHVYVLAEDAAVYAWSGAVEFTQKDGVVMRAEPYSATFLLRHGQGGWKIVLQHESALPPHPVHPVAPETKAP